MGSLFNLLMEKSLPDFVELCDGARECFQIVSPEGHFLYVNPAWCQTLGYSAREVSELKFSRLLDPEYRIRWEELQQKLVSGAARVLIRLVLRHKDGSRIEIEGNASCRFEKEAPAAIRIQFQGDRNYPNAEEELDRLFNLSLDLLCVAGTDGYFREINPAFERVLGYKKEELLKSSFLEFVHPDDRAGTLVAVERLAQGLPVVDFQNRYLAKGGTYRWLSWRSTPVAEKGLIYAVARDITEQRHIQELLIRQKEELARSNEDLEQFASVASHDLRAPLRAIANLSEWIEEDIPGELPKSTQRSLQKLRQQVRRMETMTEDLLTFARSGHEDSVLTEVNTGQLVQQIMLLLSPPESLSLTVQPGMPTLRTMKAPLEKVFRNLISNAIKHHDRPNGSISIGFRERRRFFEFRVDDDGPGIPADCHDQVFKMFQRLQTKDEVEGTGIGLSLVKRTVEGYGGRVWLKSEGRGSSFFFTWPRATARES